MHRIPRLPDTSVVHNVTGFQVATLDEMMDALDRLISDRTLRDQMGTAARKHVAQFDWDLVAAIWQAAYLDIAEDRYPAAAHNRADPE